MSKCINHFLLSFVIIVLNIFTLTGQTGLTVTGTVYDAKTYLPLANATVILDSTSTGVATNNEGLFELNIPAEYSGKLIKVSYIGFEAKYISINQESITDLRFFLEPLEIVLGEVLVKTKRLSAWDIVNKAIWAIPQNYEISPNKMECFYREISYENNTEVAVTEALLEVYKAPFNIRQSEDQVRVKKISGTNAGSGFRFEGGAFYRINDDIIKNRISFLTRDDLHYYKFDLNRVLGRGDESILVISFTPDIGEVNKENADLWGRYKNNYELTNNLYSGELFIREQDYAILKAEYWLEDELLRKADKIYLTKTPEGAIVEMTDVRFTAEYRKTDKRYYLYYTDGQICFRLGTEELGLSRDYRVFNQIVTVSRTDKNVKRIPVSEVADHMDMVPDYMEKYDNEFWKNQNIIKAYSGLEMMGEAKVSSALFRDELQKKLNNYWYENPVEKLFLHTDRNRYISGEEIFFKAYVTELSSGFPSFLSKIFHIVLADSANNIIDKLSYVLKGGFGSGSMKLPQDLAQGEYRLIAYPGYLQNLKPDDCFAQSIEIEDKISFTEDMNKNTSPKPGDRVKSENVDIQFLPEGGQFVAGVMNNIAICAVSESGKPQNLLLVIREDDHRVIDTVETNKLGLARLSFVPHKGKTYKAVIIESTALRKNVFNLPPVQSEGIALNITKKEKNKISVSLRSPGSETEELSLMLIKGKQVISSTEAEFINSTNVELNFYNVSAGVANLVVFRGGKPIAERLVFLDTDRRLKIEASPEYGAYPAREKMKIKIKVTDQYDNPIKTNLSLSVIDSFNCISDKFVMKNIRYTFWLGSLLKEAIPFRLPLNILDKISGDNDSFHNDIDLLLTTYGWRRISTEEIMKRNVVLASKPGKNYDIISGKINPLGNKKKKPSWKKLLVMDPANYYIETVFTDSEGNFTYKPEKFSYDKQLVWDFENKKDRERWEISFNETENKTFIKSLVLQSANDKNILMPRTETIANEPDRSLFADLIIIPEVIVTHKRETSMAKNFTFAEALGNAGNIKTGAPEDYIVNMDLKQLIYNIKRPTREYIGIVDDEYVHYFYYRHQFSQELQGGGQIPVLFVVNDIPVSRDYHDIEHIKPETIKKISVISGPQAHTFFGSKALGGTIMIYLKGNLNDYFIYDERKISSVISDPLCNTVREFYKPNYESDSIDISSADYRLSVHWEPNIVTDENGEATVMYYNAGYNSYVIGIINGMSYKGDPVSHRFRYRVLNEEF